MKNQADPCKLSLDESRRPLFAAPCAPQPRVELPILPLVCDFLFAWDRLWLVYDLPKTCCACGVVEAGWARCMPGGEF